MTILKKLAIVLAAGTVVCLAIFGGLRWSAANWQEPMTEQEAAQRWQGQGETAMAQVSAFLSENEALYASSLYSIRESIETEMTDAGVDPDEVPWLWAASGQTTGQVSYGDNSVSVQITAVQGDFFQFHPMTLASGSYISSEDLMHDRVVIDELTAWNLYGSSNAAGMELTYNGQSYYVAGVVQALEGEANELCYGDNTARIYIFSDGDAAGSEIPLTTVEAVIPEPVEGFALSALQSALGYQDGDEMEILQNTGRFSFSNSLSLVSGLSMRGVQTEPILYPYWENAARLTENHLAILAVLSLVALLWPAVSLIALLGWCNGLRKKYTGKVKLFGSRVVEKHRTKVYERSEHDEWNV